jgi:hypothetical protein
MVSPLARLERYTEQRRQEVLLVKVRIGEDLDEILVFKGFSSSLVRSTDFDPDVDLWTEDAEIVAIARLKAPYDPQNPEYLEPELTWAALQERLPEL